MSNDQTLAEDALERERKRFERYTEELARDLRELADTVEREGRVRLDPPTSPCVGKYASAASGIVRSVLSSLNQQQFGKLIEAAGEADFWRGMVFGERDDPAFQYKKTD